MKHKLLFVLPLFLTACGGSKGGSDDAGGGGGGGDIDGKNGSGPSSCLASHVFSGPLSANNITKSAPANWAVTTVGHFNPNTVFKPGPNFNVVPKIVGGEKLSTTTDCQSPLGASAKTISNNNTVAILLKAKGGTQETILCTGTVVASNLILTAGHCFDEVDKTAASPGRIVFASTYVGANISNAVDIGCWQRHSSYTTCDTASPSFNCILNDIAWVTFSGNASTYGYSPVNLLGNPSGITRTEEKLFAGFGKLNEQVPGDGSKYCVSTHGNTDYAGLNGGDYLPSSAVTSFNSSTSANAYQNYLTVIGPITGVSPGTGSTNSPANNFAKGTCSGDSGGPVYINRGGSWLLAALTQGSNNVLSPKPTDTAPPYTHFNSSNSAGCQYGYGVYTTVGNYINWIQTTSGQTITSQ